MTNYEIELLNKLIENCIYCGGDGVALTTRI